jgi:probable F420-dependent oxidoreductase
MRFGLQHGIGDSRWSPEVFTGASVAEFAGRAEAAGIDLLAFTDHPAPPGRWVDQGGEGTADPFSSLAFCAAVTERIRLLTFVLVASYRSPMLAAHQAATLDRLSDGRLTVGLGTGYLFGEFKALGLDPSRRRADLDELLALWAEGFEGRDLAFEGPRGTARDARILPPPLQRPRPPVWIHGNSAFGTERAAAHADGWIAMITPEPEMALRTRTAPLSGFEELGRRISGLEAAAERLGRDPAEIDVVLAGPWGMLDLRAGFEPERMRDEAGRLTELGVDWIVSLVCGDDLGASLATVDAVGAELVSPGH